MLTGWEKYSECGLHLALFLSVPQRPLSCPTHYNETPSAIIHQEPSYHIYQPWALYSLSHIPSCNYVRQLLVTKVTSMDIPDFSLRSYYPYGWLTDTPVTLRYTYSHVFYVRCFEHHLNRH